MIGSTPLPKTNYFSFQGAVLIGDRVTGDDIDNDGLVVPVGGLQFFGNIPKFDYSINSDVEEIKDSYSGLRQIDFRQSYSDSIQMDLELFDAGALAMSIAHRGQWSVIRAGSVSDASIISYNTAQKRYRVVTTAPVLYQDYFVGERATDGTWTPIRNLNAATLLVKDSTSATPKDLTEGVNYTLVARTGKIRFLDLTTGGPFLAPLKCNTNYGTVTDILSERIKWGLVYPLSHQKITQFQIQDSASTPVVVDETYYTLDPDYGELTWIPSKRTDFEAANYTLPLKAVYNHGTARHLSMLTAPLDQEWWLRLRGKNTANDNAPFLADFYRVQFSPVQGAAMIHERTGKLPLKATALADLSKDPDQILGRVGRIVQM